MKNFLIDEDIVNYLSYRYEAALIQGSDAGHDLFQSIG